MLKTTSKKLECQTCELAGVRTPLFETGGLGELCQRRRTETLTEIVSFSRGSQAILSDRREQAKFCQGISTMAGDPCIKTVISRQNGPHNHKIITVVSNCSKMALIPLTSERSAHVLRATLPRPLQSCVVRMYLPNPFHNFCHAVDVLCWLCMEMDRIKAWRGAGPHLGAKRLKEMEE